MKTLKNTLLVLISALILSACTSETENTPNKIEGETPVESTQVSTENMTAEEEYQLILNNYTEKIKNATPTLISEYNAEAASNSNGIMGLAEIMNSKVFDLAAILTEGTQEMAEVMLEKGTGSYSEYESWALKLNDVYMSEAQKITDVYMNSAK